MIEPNLSFIFTHTILMYSKEDLEELKKTNQPLSFDQSTMSLIYKDNGLLKARIDLDEWMRIPLCELERACPWAMPDIKKTKDYRRLKSHNHKTPLARPINTEIRNESFNSW